MTLTWSKYQRDIFAAFTDATESLLIEAVAGSGKTRTLEELARIMGEKFPAQRGVMVAFNKSIASELQARIDRYGFRNVTAMTLHSAGWAAWRRAGGLDWTPELVRDKTTTIMREVMTWKESQAWGETTRKLVGFAKGAGLVPHPKYCETRYEDALGEVCQNGLVLDTNEQWQALIDHYELDEDACNIEMVRRVLARGIQLGREVADFDDMLFLPVVYGVPFDRYDVVMLDEAQDVSGIQQEMVARMVSGDKKCLCAPYYAKELRPIDAFCPVHGEEVKHSRVIAVGDRHQCQPPETMVLKVIAASTRNTPAKHQWVPIHTLRDGDRVVSWGNCGGGRRWGKINNGRKIKIASREYSGKLLVVSANGQSTRTTPNHKFLIRLNDHARAWRVVYLMYRPDRGFRVGQCKLYSTHLTKDLSSCGGGTHLLNRARQEKAERLWVLAAFPTLKEARTHETLCSLRYQIPTTTYEPHEEYGDYQNIEDIFSQFGGCESGCLEAHGRLFEFPLWKSGENGTSKVIGINVWTKHYACNLIPKLMNISTAEDTEVPIDRVTTDIYIGKVYSLDVEKDHTYLADGLTTCNSIYGFRGALATSMDDLKRRFGMRELPLSVSYRCPIAVVRKAQTWVPQIEWAEGAEDGYVGEEGTDWAGQCDIALGAPICCNCEHREEDHLDTTDTISEDERQCVCVHCSCKCYKQEPYEPEGISKWRGLADFLPGDAILCRLTRPLVEAAFTLIRGRIACRVLGRDIEKGLTDLVRRVLKRARLSEDSGLGAFVEALGEYLGTQRGKLTAKRKIAELGRLEDQVTTVLVFAEEREHERDEASVRTLIADIERLFVDNGASKGMVVLSTIHKFKGMETDRVFVLDASETLPCKWARQAWELAQEANLAYVACTRAKRELRYITSSDIRVTPKRQEEKL